MDLVYNAAVLIPTVTMLVNHASALIHRHKNAVTENQHQATKIVQSVRQVKTAQIQVCLFAAMVLAVNAATILETTAAKTFAATVIVVQTLVTCVAAVNAAQKMVNAVDLMDRAVHRDRFAAPTPTTKLCVFLLTIAATVLLLIMEKYVVVAWFVLRISAAKVDAVVIMNSVFKKHQARHVIVDRC